MADDSDDELLLAAPVLSKPKPKPKAKGKACGKGGAGAAAAAVAAPAGDNRNSRVDLRDSRVERPASSAQLRAQKFDRKAQILEF